MAKNRPIRYIICYDIANPKRLVRVHRCLKGEGLPLQYSVFNCCLTERQLKHLMDKLQKIIDPRADDIRIYPLPERSDCVTLGKQMFPDDIMLFRAGGDLMDLK
ncbi:MAG: CRISPR-associated endonuclease Cas2 [Methylococcaceae bacterium]